MGRADLHVHTRYSPDAISDIAAVLKKAKERQLNVVAITDHDTIEGAKEAQKIAPYFNVEVVISEEVTVKEGHILALFIKEKIKPGRSALETIKEIHQQGGLAVVPHPDNKVPGGISFNVLFRIFNELDAIELLNGGWFGWLQQEQSIKLNNSTFKLAAVGGSDSHLAGHVGCAYTIFEGKTPLDLYQSIKARKTKPGGSYWSYKDRLLWLLSYPIIFCKAPLSQISYIGEIFKRYFK
jgi:hypothetical protein